MKKKITIPAFIFKPVYSEKITTEVYKRQDDVLEIEFPVFDKKVVLKTAESLSLKKRRAHDRDIDDVIEVIDQVGALWSDPNYEFRKEALEVLPITSGQSKVLCEIELTNMLSLLNKKSIENELLGQIGGKQYLEEWIPKNDVRIHAQPRGVILHNLAGNAFLIGVMSLSYGLITKNVNLLKLPHEEPYVPIKFCESMADIDKKIAKEIAALYWQGSRGDIFNELFNSGNVNCVVAWGGIDSIEDIRRRAYRYGIKIIDNGPKLSFCVVSEDLFKDVKNMEEIANKVAIDVVCWNQKACLSPRVIYIVDNPQKSAIFHNNGESISDMDLDLLNNKNKENNVFDVMDKKFNGTELDDLDVGKLMKRSIKLLKNEYSELSPFGFAKMLAKGLKNTDLTLPRTHLTQADGMEMEKKREYFFMNYVTKKRATIIYPPKNKLNWTVVYLRDLPTMMEIDKCQDRFVIVSRISSIQDLIYSMRKEKLQKYLQTISIYGADDFVKNVAEEFSLLGAFRFPHIGEHNSSVIGVPWDGEYILQDLIKWVYIEFLEQKEKKNEKEKFSLFGDLKIPNKV
ncbi:MAG: acyl-CoA reductase [Promethearchaeota archaeon]